MAGGPMGMPGMNQYMTGFPGAAGMINSGMAMQQPGNMGMGMQTNMGMGMPPNPYMGAAPSMGAFATAMPGGMGGSLGMGGGP